MAAPESIARETEALGSGTGDVAAAPSAPSPVVTPWQIAAILIPLGIIGILYSGTLWRLIQVWEDDPNYSHGFVVPFFALGLAWIAYQRSEVFPVGGAVTRSSVILGSIEIAAGFALHLFCMFLGKLGLFFDVAALIFMLWGTVLVLGGPVANATYRFPILFLIFMAPLPAQVYDPVALQMQAIASIVAANLFEFVGIAALREGYVIHIPGHSMEVAGECSGMRSLTTILALAMAIGYLSGRGAGFRWILGLLSAPVAIGVNCLRVFGTGLIMMYIGPQWATGKAHEYQGLFMVGFAALMLVGLAWLLAKIEDTYFKPPAAAPVLPADVPPAELKAPGPVPST